MQACRPPSELQSSVWRVSEVCCSSVPNAPAGGVFPVQVRNSADRCRELEGIVSNGSVRHKEGVELLVTLHLTVLPKMQNVHQRQAQVNPILIRPYHVRAVNRWRARCRDLCRICIEVSLRLLVRRRSENNGPRGSVPASRPVSPEVSARNQDWISVEANSPMHSMSAQTIRNDRIYHRKSRRRRMATLSQRPR